MKKILIFTSMSLPEIKYHLFAGTMACMIWKGTPYYAHMDYNDKRDPADGLPDEDVTAIDEIPVYSINKPKPESLAVLKILDSMKSVKNESFGHTRKAAQQ